MNFGAEIKSQAKENDDGLAIDSDRLAIDSDRLAIGGDGLAIDSDRSAKILRYLYENGSGKSSDFIKLFGVSPQRVRQIIQGMIKNNLIEKHGDKRHTYYTAVDPREGLF